ncbi:MAG TPA: hypothetical protein VIM02_00210 [Rhizomicrobium sp.]|jgi:hypothetical protein
MKRLLLVLAAAAMAAPLLSEAGADGWLDGVNRHLTPQGSNFVSRETELLIAGEVPLQMLESDVKAACPHPHSCLDEPSMGNEDIKLAICALAAERADHELQRLLNEVRKKNAERKDAQLEMIALQAQLNKRNAYYDMMSSMLEKQRKMHERIINNMR